MIAAETLPIDAARAPTPAAATPLSPAAAAVAARLAPHPRAPGMIADLVRLADLAAIGLAGFAARPILGPALGAEDLALDLALVAAAALGTVLGVGLLEGYRAHAFARAAMRVAAASAALTTALAAALGAGLAVRAGLGWTVASWVPTWAAWWWALAFAGIALARLALAPRVRAWIRDGRLERRAVIVGGGTGAEALIAGLAGEPEIRVCGVFDDRGDDRVPPLVAGCPKLGTVAELVEFGRRTRLDLLVVALPIRAEARLVQLLDQLWVLPVDIRLLAGTGGLKFTRRSYSHLGGAELLDLLDRPIARWHGVAKRGFDLAVGALMLAAFAPLLALTALAIKLDSRGPVFFRQNRHGFNNEVIRVWKFRSLFADRTDHDARRAVTRGDPRVTRVGRVIRRTSIDELPQLLNVLAGELSLVGPRPHPVHSHTGERTWDQIADGYFARHRVKPGITGWAQVNGWRGEVDTPEKIRARVEHDLHYIENWSVLLDLRILAMTPISLIATKNAF